MRRGHSAPFQNHADMVLREADLACFIANWETRPTICVCSPNASISAWMPWFFWTMLHSSGIWSVQLVPEVCVPEMPDDPAEFVSYLESLNLFEATQVSAEDRRRTEFYKTNALRRKSRRNLPTSTIICSASR